MFHAPADTNSPPGEPNGYRLTLAYDGTDFFGWQVQPELRTVQGTLAEVVHAVTGELTLPQGSGRTDTGVHASGQVVSLQLQARIPPDRLQRALNRRLPSAIRVVELCRAEPGFHARANVLEKTYEYRIFERRPAPYGEERICLPQTARYAWDCRWPLQLGAMQEAASAVIGTHDFLAFAASDPDRRARDKADARDTVRTITQSHWSREDGLLLYRVTGNGFLHHMVRNLVGTWVSIGSGRLPAGSADRILGSRSRSAAGETAPPQGLHLMRVVYRSDIHDNEGEMQHETATACSSVPC